MLASERLKKAFRIGLDRIQSRATMIVGYRSSQDPEQVVERLQLRRVCWQIDELQPPSMTLQQRGDAARFLGPMEMGIVRQHDRPATSSLRPLDQGIAQCAEGQAIPPVGVAVNGRAIAPVHGREEMPFAIGPGGGHLGLMAAPHPAAGQGGQQRQLSFILRIHIRPRRGAYFEGLGAGLFDW